MSYRYLTPEAFGNLLYEFSKRYGYRVKGSVQVYHDLGLIKRGK